MGWVVPAGLLERPAKDELRNVDRSDCALAVDDALRRLASQESRCRLVAGAVAREFLDRRAHHRLGFVRVGDYTRERLSWSARELQETARTVAALDSLPHIAAAFRWGKLSWTKVRLLTGVVSAADELEWLAEADGRTVRALAARIRSTRSDDPASTSPDADDTIEGEPMVRFNIRCPRRVCAAWRYVVELAGRMSGARIPMWRAAEAIAGEGISGALSSAAPRSAAPDAVAGDANTAWSRDDARCGSSRPLRTSDICLDTARDRFPALDWTVVREAIPEDVTALAQGLAELDAVTLDARLRAVVRCIRSVDWQVGRLLRLCFDLRLYLPMGFSSREEYVRERLGISTSKARMLVAVERHTWRVPALMDAYRDGELSALQALTLAPILDEPVARAWLQRSGDVTLRRLWDEVTWALDVRDAATRWSPIAPPALGSPLPRPERQMRAPGPWEDCVATVTFVGPLSGIALFRSAISAFRVAGEPDWRAFERLIDHARAEWLAQPRHRDPIFERDGWRCTVPACTSRCNLHDHHIQWRSRGGNNAQDNRSTVCAGHHLHGIHAGFIATSGHAPHAIHWQLGVARGRPPFLELLGDTYLMRAKGGAAANAIR